MNINVSHWVMFLVVIFTLKVPVFLLHIPQYVDNEYNISRQQNLSLYAASL